MLLALGTFDPGSTVYLPFNTRGTNRAPITLAGSPVVSVSDRDDTTESTAGVTLNVDFDNRTGLHLAVINTAADTTFYADGRSYSVVVTTGTVNSISVVGKCVGTFTLSGSVSGEDAVHRSMRKFPRSRRARFGSPRR